ncbi:MAG TPA: DUF2251 domain-containing protein [Terracidiphilus sp.]|nr:DUF2251 domain-containing protein [Terracidiphilus sp.]
MIERRFKPGVEFLVESDAPGQPFSSFFEDEGETGYFYALDLRRAEDQIVDAVHIYNAASVIDRERDSSLAILWSDDGLKCALLINGYPHAAFDFGLRRGYCRTNFPIFKPSASDAWSTSDHSWSDEAVSWLK